MNQQEGTALSLYVPEPQQLVPVGYASQIREIAARSSDISEVDKARHGMDALERLITDRLQREEVQAAQRWCETRIGELLGPASETKGARTDLNPNLSLACDRLTADDVYRFRRMADNVDVVEKAIASGKTSRAAILKLIDLKYLTERESVEPDGIFDVIVADPPWPMVKIDREVAPNQTEFDYPTMSITQIEGYLASRNFAPAENCHLWLWTTHRFLPDALRVMEAWGFKYVCTFVWHKPGGFQPFGLPQYNCEFALYGRRGSPGFVETKDFPVCFSAPRGEHSEKPQIFYDMVKRTTAGLRLDMFNRRAIDGFVGHGNQADE